MKRFIFLAFLCWIAGIVELWASTLEHAKNVNSRTWDAHALSIEGRKAAAVAMEAYWNSFVERLPRLPPTETEWLIGELSSNQSERITAVINRKEYGLHILLNKAEECRNAYRAIAARAGTDPKWEALAWVRSLNCYRDVEDTFSYLRKNGLTGERYDGAFNIAFFGIWESWIINKVVEPTLFPHPK